MHDPDLEDLAAAFDVAAIRAALKAAYERGRAKAYAEVRENVLKAVDLPTPIAPIQWPPTPATEVTSEKKDHKRAPKGLTETVLQHVLEAEPGLTVGEVANRAVAIDERISPKTIYNTLRLQKDRYRLDGERWFLRRHAEWPMMGAPRAPVTGSDNLT